MSGPEPSDPEDAKIISLARASRARTGAAEGACLRDTDGRTYAATSVELPHLALSAVAVAIAMAVSSGAPGLEAVAVSRDEPVTAADRAVVEDLAGEAAVKLWHVDARGAVLSLHEVRRADR